MKFIPVPLISIIKNITHHFIICSERRVNLKVAILQNSIGWTETQIEKLLKIRGHNSSFITLDDPGILDYNLVINRLMPEISAEDPSFNLQRFFNIITSVEASGIPILNGRLATGAGYDKFAFSLLLNAQSIRTPRTSGCKSSEAALSISNTMYKYPVIKKPSLSGGGKNIKLIETQAELASDHDWKTVHGQMLIQEYFPSVEFEDYKIYLWNNELLFGHRRSLLGNWLGSYSMGSKIRSILNREIPLDVMAEAMLAAKAIKATFCSCDVTMTKNGPYVIDIDTSPNFTEEYLEIYGFNPVEVLVNRIEDMWLK